MNKYTQRIFSLLSFSSLFELPSYFVMVIQREYTDRTAYSFHILANMFYFASFSVLCFAWGDVLRAKNLEELFEAQVRSKIRMLIVFGNIIFLCHSVFAIYACASADTLQDYFNTKSYTVYTISDTAKNFIMGIFIFKFGGNLYSRVLNYSAFYGSSIRDVEAVTETTKYLLTASDKLKVLVVVINFCFSLRIVAVVIWLCGNAPTENEEPSSFQHLDFLFWSLLETLPVVLPSLTLCCTMGCLAKVFGGTFIDANKKNRMNSVSGCPTVLNPRKIYESDSSDDNSSTDNLPTLKSLSGPLLSNQVSGLDDDDTKEALFNRLSRVSGELVDIDFERNSVGQEKSKETDGSHHYEVGSVGSSSNSIVFTPRREGNIVTTSPLTGSITLNKF